MNEIELKLGKKIIIAKPIRNGCVVNYKKAKRKNRVYFQRYYVYSWAQFLSNDKAYSFENKMVMTEDFYKKLCIRLNILDQSLPTNNHVESIFPFNFTPPETKINNLYDHYVFRNPNPQSIINLSVC